VEAVKNANIKASANLCHFLVSIAVLILASLKLTPKKKPPSSPEIQPIIIAPGITDNGTTTSGLALANLRALSEKLIGIP
jgi:hypothetical protein